MPTLKQLTCHIEAGLANTQLGEHGTTYADGYVETFVAIPSHPSTFNVHLTSSGYIAPGIAMFVYIDGKMQCNRNRCGLFMPGPGTQPHDTEIDFRVRQKEEKFDQGRYIGREWTFEGLTTAPPTAAPNISQDLLNNVGTIEVVVLRCYGSDAAHSSSYAVPEMRTTGGKTLKRQTFTPKRSSGKAQEQKPKTDNNDGGLIDAFMGLFDGANDLKNESSSGNIPLGLDGQNDTTFGWTQTAPNRGVYGANMGRDRLAFHGSAPAHAMNNTPRVLSPTGHYVKQYPPSPNPAALDAAFARQGLYPSPYPAPAQPYPYTAPYGQTYPNNPYMVAHQPWTQPAHGAQPWYPMWAPSAREPVPSHLGAYYQAGRPPSLQQGYVNAWHRNQSIHSAQAGARAVNPNDDRVKQPSHLSSRHSQAAANDNQGGWGDNKSNNGNDNQGGWGNSNSNNNANDNNDWNKPSQNNDNGWGDSNNNNANNDNGWDKPAQNNDNTWDNKPTAQDISTPKKRKEKKVSRGSNTTKQEKGSQASPQLVDPERPYIKSYWSQPPGIVSTSASGNKRTESVFIVPEEPLPAIPNSIAEERGLSHQVQAGKGVIYHHRTGVPKYMDTMKNPYAVFVFKYRTKDALKKILNLEDIHDAKGSYRKKVEAMTKEGIIEQLIKAKAAAGYHEESSLESDSEDDESGQHDGGRKEDKGANQVAAGKAGGGWADEPVPQPTGGW